MAAIITLMRYTSENVVANGIPDTKKETLYGREH